jgi:hypothetical protein
MKAQSFGYEGIDLDLCFFGHNAACTDVRVNADGHWNEIGHAVTANSVLA